MRRTKGAHKKADYVVFHGKIECLKMQKLLGWVRKVPINFSKMFISLK